MIFVLSKQIRDGKLFLNIIDVELKNKILENEKTKIDLTNFYYQGNDADEQKIIPFFEHAAHIQFIGNNSVKLGKKHNLISTVSEIEKIKYAFVIKM